ncbi:DUF4411 family protein [Bacillaceae bacterium Marseille-Q3522]|nr:DUF4411 family protein [Bacillaceae bacterium Marseille-Q3522]
MGIIVQKKYMLDTNVFRYKTASGSQHKREAKQFWRMALTELENSEAEIVVPMEVKRELEVQSLTLYERERNKLEALLANLVITDDVSSIQSEHLVRKMSAHLRSQYKHDLDIIGRGVEYHGISDARILLNGWQHYRN